MSIFQGQMGDSPPMFGVSQYSFESEVWEQLSYYPSKCLGKAAIKGEFELPDPDQVDNETQNQEPKAKKAKTERKDEKSEEEIAAIKLGTRSFKNLKCLAIHKKVEYSIGSVLNRNAFNGPICLERRLSRRGILNKSLR